MAKAVAVCVCPECGKTYERRIDGWNRADAENRKSYAENHPGLCPLCWKKEQQGKAANEAAALKAKYQLPDIVGVSDKQTVYADRLRYKFAADNEHYMNELPYIINNLKDASFVAAKAQECNKTPEELKSLVLAELNGNILYRRAYAMLTKSSAREIIDNLNNQPDAITL